MKKNSKNLRELRAVRIAFEKTGDYVALMTNLWELEKAGNTDAAEIMWDWRVTNWQREQEGNQPLRVVEPINADGDIYTE